MNLDKSNHLHITEFNRLFLYIKSHHMKSHDIIQSEKKNNSLHRSLIFLNDKALLEIN